MSLPFRLPVLVLSLLTALAGTLAGTPAGAQQAAPLAVVASFSVLGDMVREIGGSDVTVTTLVPPGGDAHVYQPRPADAKRIAGARLVMVNGLGMEGWLDRLIAASGYRGPVVVVSDGVTPQTMQAEADHGHNHGHNHGHSHGPRKAVVTDPHAWQNLANGAVYARNITEALAAADPAHADAYRTRGSAYLARLKELDAWVKAQIAAVPAEKRRIITSHDAFGYFGRAYGIEFLAPVGISTDAEPSAAGVSRLIRQMRREKIRALFVENMTDQRLVRQLASETGAELGGTLYSDSLSPAGGPADTYIGMFRHNVPAMAAAMRKN
ncbi:metal ABC transporter substrate-binding protein [Ferrovibrio sp.]|uniref:metal ABC transporter substrate-binding protein n=1 Tax=Ferrovibrio sp. TaxID=1917215 RepID=UPI0035136B4B